MSNTLSGPELLLLKVLATLCVESYEKTQGQFGATRNAVAVKRLCDLLGIEETNPHRNDSYGTLYRAIASAAHWNDSDREHFADAIAEWSQDTQFFNRG